MRRLSLIIAVISLIASLTPRPAAFVYADDQVDSILQSMTLDQKIGQLFMVSLYGPNIGDTNSAFLRAMMPGAVALGDDNGNSPQAVTQITNAMQALAVQTGSKLPLFISIDQEGGTVIRLTTGFTSLPWGGALSAMPLDDAQQVGQIAGAELRAVGVNMNLAPVADVRTRPDSYFMAQRVFGNDPDRVGSAVSAYMKGLQASSAIPVLKHFPGHGDASDSHVELPVVNDDQDRVWNVELLPFRTAIAQGADAVMVGHLSFPALDPDLPTSLSSKVITDLLRNKIGFNGLVMTDAMDMGAIVNHYTRPVASVMAINAGIDLITAGPNTPLSEQLAMRDAVLKAAQSGDIPATRIDDAVRHILTVKAKYGLLTWTALAPNEAATRVDTADHQTAINKIYFDTVAVAQDTDHHLPLKPGGQKVALIFPGAYPIAQRECSALDAPATALAYSLNPTSNEQAAVPGIARTVDVVVIFTYNINLYPAQAKLVNGVPPEKAVVVALQSPFDIERGIQPGAYVTMFNPYPPAFKAACAVLYGQSPIVGQWTLSKSQ